MEKQKDRRKAYMETLKRKRIARSVNLIRRSLGMSQNELAELAGYKNGASIAAIENGTSEPSFDRIKDIANALGVSINQLRLTGKIETNEDGWPKLKESDRLALFLLSPIIKSLDEERLNQLLEAALVISQANGKTPEWNKTEYQEKKEKEGRDV